MSNKEKPKLTMRIFIVFMALAFLAAACNKKDQLPAPSINKPLIIKDTTGISFKAIPLSPTQLKISFLFPGGRKLTKLLLKKDTATIAEVPVSDDNNNLFSATVNYNFSGAYKLMVQAAPLNDTMYQYTLPDYQHVYKQLFNYQKLFTIRQSVSFDITPSRNIVYLVDDSDNVLTLKRFSLKSLTVDTFKTEFSPLTLRAVSDDELLMARYDVNGRFLQEDSAALYRYNVVTKQADFVDWFSRDYGRISRVINNHVLVTNPIFTAGTVSLVNLSDNSKVAYPTDQMNFTRVRELSFDHLYYKNQVVDAASGTLTDLLPIGDSMTLDYVDEPSQLRFVSQYVLNNSSYDSRFFVYHQNSIIYQDNFDKSRLILFPRQLYIQKNQVIFYQHFGYGTEYRTDGYYALDLNTGKLTLVQCDSNPYVIYDFQVDANSVISIRADGIYKLTY